MVPDILQFIGERWVVTFNKRKIPAQKTRFRFIRPMTEDGWRPITHENPISHAPPAINDLIIRCCDHNPKLRPSFKEILDEFNGICKEQIDAKPYGRRPLEIDSSVTNNSSSGDTELGSDKLVSKSFANAPNNVMHQVEKSSSGTNESIALESEQEKELSRGTTI